MEKFTKLTGVAAPLPMRNEDATVITPGAGNLTPGNREQRRKE